MTYDDLRSGPDLAATRESQIEQIARDETLPILERQARLERLAAEWDLESDADETGITDPFRQQIANALAMLAQGGHR